MDRRGFLQALLAGAIAAHELDVDKLLWVPGEKKIFIPPPGQPQWATEALQNPRYVEITKFGDSLRTYMPALAF